MEARPATTSTTTTNPPSVEIAYKRKCAALKKRLAEVEAENDLMRTRNLRGYQYIQKMRLESCMLLERLAKVTGMADEAAAGKADPELRARAAALMSNVSALNEVGAGEQVADGVDLDDETEGSSDEQPPTVCEMRGFFFFFFFPFFLLSLFSLPFSHYLPFSHMLPGSLYYSPPNPFSHEKFLLMVLFFGFGIETIARGTPTTHQTFTEIKHPP